MRINNRLLSERLSAANLPIVGVASDGRIDYSRPPTPEEKKLVESILKSHNPNEMTALERGQHNRTLARESLIKMGEVNSDNLLEVVKLICTIVLGE